MKSPRPNLRLCFSFALAAGLLSACHPKAPEPPPAPPPPPPAALSQPPPPAPAPEPAAALHPAPTWHLQDLDGHDVSSDEFKGKVVVVDFWATWCGPCRSEIPGYVALQKKYADDGLVVIGISVDQDSPAAVKQFAVKHGMTYRVLMADQSIVDAFGGMDAIPTTFIIDRAGNIRLRKVGAMPEAEFEKKLLPYL